MGIELFCPDCHAAVAIEEDTPAAEVMERWGTEGPWSALDDGATLEDMLFSSLTARDAVRCPECRRPVSLTEESLGRASMQLLASW